MKTFWQVGIIESKKFDGTAEHAAIRDQRTRLLTFDILEDAVAEFQRQVDRCKATVEYSKRHKATEEINIIVNVIKNGVQTEDPYWFEVNYSNQEIKYDFKEGGDE